MKETRKKLTRKQMEKITSGGTPALPIKNIQPQNLTQTPHCRNCSGEMSSYNSLFRCQTGGCKECGKDKTAAEVDWY